ncbi:polyamine ABC transporter substrate-binding protein [Thioalkalivibrio sp. HK1]|uniref:polyamine ABC transporter substrate-binding protein n=1 Tax=Thioalkalivibrio sp. HK1 TaxID=1469245 RepID=UPI0004B3DEA2|nr:spermidine/putrescine ABC transporter substrate-binding protein [Thioalkalivibrio sp. HK1]
MMKTRYGYRPSRRRFLAGVGATAAAGLTLPKFGWAAEEPKLNFYNWDTYIGETTLDDFKKASGIEVKMDLFADNDELFAKLKEGNPGYDLIVPTNDYVERMISEDMLVEIDHSKISNLANIEDVFMKAVFDPGRRYSLPYMWGTIGIGYRKSALANPPTSWRSLYDSDEFSGRIALLADSGVVIGIGLKYLGYSFNDADPAHIKEVEALLIRQKGHIKTFAEDNGQDLLASGEVDLTMEWNGDILQVMDEDDDIGYSVPEEGGLLWEDTLAIPTGAPHPENAHRFIDYILDAQVGASIAEFIYYATPNKAAKQYLPADYLENPAIFPPPETVEKSETAIYLGEERQRLIDEAWTRINAA